MQNQVVQFEADGAVLDAYVKDESPRVFIMGPLGSGKTQGSCYKLFDLFNTQTPNREGIRRGRWYAVRNTYSDLLTTTWKDWMELFAPLGRAVKGNMEPPTHYLDYDLEDGTRVKVDLIFLAMDRPDDVRKVRGSNATGMWLNEVKELPFEIIAPAFSRTGRFPPVQEEGCRWHGIVADYNACDNDHPLYEMCENEQPEGWSFHKQPPAVLRDGTKRDIMGKQIWKLNPDAENAVNLRADYYTEQLNGAKEDWVKVNLANEYGYVSDGKPVYPEFVDHVHVIDSYEPNPVHPVIIGIDFGRTPAAAFIQKIPGINRYVGFDEFLTKDMSAAKFGPELKKYIDQHYSAFDFQIWGDPAGDKKGEAVETTPMQILQKNGIQCRPISPHMGGNNPLVRRSAIINPMTELAMDGRPMFLIVGHKCPVWRKGLAGGFCYKRKNISGEAKYHDEPDKNSYSHICEAGEYGLQGSGEGQQAIRGESKFKNDKPIMMNTHFDAYA